MGVWCLVPARLPDRQVAIGIGVVEQPGYGLFIFKFFFHGFRIRKKSFGRKIFKITLFLQIKLLFWENENNLVYKKVGNSHTACRGLATAFFIAVLIAEIVWKRKTHAFKRGS